MRRSRRGRTLMSLVLAAALAVGLCPAPALAGAGDAGGDREGSLRPQRADVISVPYLDEKGEEQVHDCTVIAEGAGITELNNDWYVVSGEKSLGSPRVVGDVSIVLCDGAAVSVSSLIAGTEGGSLTIYAQSTGDNMGSINCYPPADQVGIEVGTLTVNGGYVGAHAYDGPVGTKCTDAINVNGGRLSSNGDIAILADGCDITMTGGVIEAQGKNNGETEASKGIVLTESDGSGGTFRFSSGEVYASGLTRAFEGNVVLGEKMVLTAGPHPYYAQYIVPDLEKWDQSDQYVRFRPLVEVAGVSLNKDSVNLAPGKSETLYASFDPYDADLTDLTWSSSDEGVATVEDGVVTAVAEGDATITATSVSNPEASATCSVSVKALEPVKYLDENGEQQTCEDYTIVESFEGGVTWPAGWYVVNSNITTSGSIYASGPVHVILCDGCSLQCGGLSASSGEGMDITIYAQSAGSARGSLSASSAYGDGMWMGGRLTVNGGDVSAISTAANPEAVGVYAGGGVTVNGGTFVATSQEGASGISTTDLVVNGGSVMASAPFVNAEEGTGGTGVLYDSLTMNGGSLTASGGLRSLAPSVEGSPGITLVDETTITAGVDAESAVPVSSIADLDADAKWVSLEAPHVHDGHVYQKWTGETTLPSEPGYYYLDGDVLTFDTWNVPAGGMFICLNGHQIGIGGTETHISCEGSEGEGPRTLTIYDATGDGGVYNGDGSFRQVPLVTVGDGWTLTLMNGTISRGNYGGVRVNGGGTFLLRGGSISGVSAYDEDAKIAGVYVDHGAVFDMSGGSITDNMCKLGGVYVEGGDASAMPGELRISGDAKIKDNSASWLGFDYLNVNLREGKNGSGEHDPTRDSKILVSGELTDGFEVGVSKFSPGVFTSGWSEHMEGKSPSGFFNCDLEVYQVALMQGEAAMIEPVTGVSLNKESLSLEVGKTETLTATVLPDIATDKSVSWTSSDKGVAIVEDGVVTGKSAGSAIITATSVSNPSATATCAVTVKAAPGPGPGPGPEPGPDPDPDPDPQPARQEMFRLYNPYSGEHFYTGSAYERDAVEAAGWNYEGVGWVAPATSEVPVYRLYNPYAGDHHYTTSAFERDALTVVGWLDEGIGWYSAGENGTPLFRQYNPYAAVGTHNYTASRFEADHLVTLGWMDEGIGWYGL